jgi:dTDP-4-amino-4,6-dideoxygalactose transaminase
MKQIPMVNVRAQTEECGEELTEAITKVIESGRFIKGEDVEAFEEEWAEYCGAKYCVSCGNGTDALYLALKAYGIGIGNSVIVPVNSFTATAEAVSMTGAKPIFVDCDDNYMMDHTQALLKSRYDTEITLPVDLYGRGAGWTGEISDSCQAHGLKQTSNVGAYSFFPGKNLGCMGDGGALVTDDKWITDYCNALKDHGRSSDGYHHNLIGINSRLDSIQAAVLRVKLKRLDKWNNRRKEIAKKYIDNLNDCGMLPEYVENHSWHQFVIRVLQRERVREELKEKGIATNVHYPNLIAETYGETDLELKYPNAYKFSKEVMSIPIHGCLNDEDVDYIIKSIRSVT